MISSRGEEQFAATAAEIRAATGAEVAHVAADVSKADDLDRLLTETERQLGGVDVLVNNAGVRGPVASTRSTTPPGRRRSCSTCSAASG